LTTTELVENKDRREGKGRVIALSRLVYRIINTDAFYVESETKDGLYYYVVFNTDRGLEWCSCKDHENARYKGKCKHLHGVEFSIKMGTYRDTDKLPSKTRSYKEDEYSF
jgi:predicted nucleic acid-binding Zn finger protein